MRKVRTRLPPDEKAALIECRSVEGPPENPYEGGYSGFAVAAFDLGWKAGYSAGACGKAKPTEHGFCQYGVAQADRDGIGRGWHAGRREHGYPI